MEENVRKIRKSRISKGMRGAVRRGRLHRFSKWTELTYGIPWRSMYEKMRRGRIKLWERQGITECMKEYGFEGKPQELWDTCGRNHFAAFMEKRQMSRMTVWRKFSTGDFSELEMEGISTIYRKWRGMTDSKKEDA